MSRTLMRRLDRLEQRSPAMGKVHVVFGDIGADEDALDRKVDEFAATSPDYREGDTIIAVRWVAPRKEAA